MNESAPSVPPWSRREFAALAAILALTLALRMQFVHEPFERDEGWYACIGREILRGGIPYRDAIEIKPPGIMYLYAGMIALVGPSVGAIRLLTALYTLLTVVSVHAIGRLACGVRAGLVAAALFALHSGLPGIQGSGSNTEVFLNLPVCVAVWLVVRWSRGGGRSHLVLAGVASGAAFLLKATALPAFLLLAGFVAVVSWRRGLRIAVADVAALAVPPVVLYVAAVAYLAANGALDAFVYWTITFLGRYGDVRFEVWTGRMLASGERVMTEELLLWIAAVPAAAWLFFRERSRVARLLALFVPAQILAVALPKQFFLHYYIQLVPALSIAAGIGLTLLWERRPRARAAVFAVAAGALTVAAWRNFDFYFTYTPEQVCIAKYGPGGQLFVQAREVGSYVRARSSPDDSVFQWGWEPEIYFYADRRPANAYLAARLVGDSADPAAALDEVTRSLFTERPVYVVFNDDSGGVHGTREMLDLVRFHYRLETRIGRFDLYRRKGS